MKIGGRLVIKIGGRLVIGVGSSTGGAWRPGRLIIVDPLAATPKAKTPNTMRYLRIAEDRFISFPF